MLVKMVPIYKDSKYFLYHITAAVLCATFLAFFASCSSNRKVTHPSQSDRNYRYEQTNRKTDGNSSYTPEQPSAGTMWLRLPMLPFATANVMAFRLPSHWDREYSKAQEAQAISPQRATTTLASRLQATGTGAPSANPGNR